MGGREKQRVDGRKNREPLGEALAKISISRMWGQGPELRSGERGPGSGPHPAAELTNPWARKLSRARRPAPGRGRKGRRLRNRAARHQPVPSPGGRGSPDSAAVRFGGPRSPRRARALTSSPPRSPFPRGHSPLPPQ